MKRKLIVEEWVSLDGHVSDKADKLDFFVKYVRASYPSRAAFLNAIDTIAFGRKTYEQFAALWPARPIEDDPLAKKINTGSRIVFSDSLKEAPWGDWPSATLESGDPVAAMHKLKAAPGGDIVLWGSVTLAQALMTHKLVDELHLHICPVLTGGGRKFFTEGASSELRLTETSCYSDGAVLLRYSTSATANL